MNAKRQTPLKIAGEVQMKKIQHDMTVLRRTNERLIEALRRAKDELWEALGGNDDADCREMADRLCKRYEDLLREIGEVK